MSGQPFTHTLNLLCKSSSEAACLQAVLGEIVLVAYLFAVTYWRPYIAKADNFLAMGSLFGMPPLQPLLIHASALAIAPWHTALLDCARDLRTKAAGQPALSGEFEQPECTWTSHHICTG